MERFMAASAGRQNMRRDQKTVTNRKAARCKENFNRTAHEELQTTGCYATTGPPCFHEVDGIAGHASTSFATLPYRAIRTVSAVEARQFGLNFVLSSSSALCKSASTTPLEASRSCFS